MLMLPNVDMLHNVTDSKKYITVLHNAFHICIWFLELVSKDLHYSLHPYICRVLAHLSQQLCPSGLDLDSKCLNITMHSQGGRGTKIHVTISRGNLILCLYFTFRSNKYISGC